MKITEERARTYGEVLTPTWMAQAMLAPLGTDILTGRVLDLGSGPGSFLVEILTQRLAGQDRNPTGVLLTLTELYGFELLPDNIQTCKSRMLAVVKTHLGENAEQSILDLAANILDQNLLQVDVLTQQNPQIPTWVTLTEHVLQPLGSGFFSVIVSNPPYQKNISQLGTRNQSKSTPLYHLFYDYARALNPKHICFIMPAKWYTGGWGLDKWRLSVLKDRHIRVLQDYRDSNFIFPNTEVNGGICWVWWDRDYVGDAQITRYDRTGQLISQATRPLLEPGSDFFVRNEDSIHVLRKVNSFNLADEARFSRLVLATTPFGIASNFKDYVTNQDSNHDISLYYIKEREYWVTEGQVTANESRVADWKIFLPLCYNQHSPQIIGKPKIANPHSVCTHSYLAIIGFNNETEVMNCITYMKTKFFRFLAHQLKISPIATRQVYRLIPVQDWTKPWTDAELYAKYDFTESEIQHIENTISDMS